jgi:hypothetical protein
VRRAEWLAPTTRVGDREGGAIPYFILNIHYTFFLFLSSSLYLSKHNTGLPSPIAAIVAVEDWISPCSRA